MQTAVRAVRGGEDLARFVTLPWRIYTDDSRWVPPLLSERRRFLDRSRNPFFHHAEAEYFLAWRDGEAIGRICAHVDRRLDEHQGSEWGLWGLFECRDDPHAAHALLAAAEGWLRARGRDRMVGPLDFTTNHPCGLLVEGHELPPQILEPWQYPYYRELVEGYGLVKAVDLLKWEQRLDDRERFLPVVFDLAERLESDHGIRIRHMRRRGQDVRTFVSVYHAAWSRNWGFVPLTEAEVDHYVRELWPVLDPDWALIAEREGQPVGAALALPDYNQVLRRLDGRLLPLGWLRALVARRRIDEVRVFALGVMPAWQHTGVAAGLYVEFFRVAERTGVKRAEAGWILEANVAMNRAMEAVGARVVKRHRIYEKLLRPEH